MRNNKFDFRTIPLDGKKKIKIENRKKYKIPAGANAVMVYAGYLSFGRLNFEREILMFNSMGDPIKRKRGRFFKKPAAPVSHISFPHYKYREGTGHYYGAPAWYML